MVPRAYFILFCSGTSKSVPSLIFYSCPFQELKKASALKSQLENYKRQVHELHAKVSEETRRADKADFEGKRQLERVGQMQTELEVCS